MSGYGFKDSDSLARKTIDVSSRFTGLGSSGASTYNVINGLSITGGIPQLPVNTDVQGFTFFTRPQLNLTYDNVISSRRMANFANQDPYGVANAIRCLLQPDGFVARNVYTSAPGAGRMESAPEMDVRSLIVDDKNPFITVLSNTLLTMNGFPDWSVDTFTSDEGLAKEQVSWIDDRPYFFSTYDLTANFSNLEGDIINHLFYLWIHYATNVKQGTMMPFPINVVTNRIDYMTRIYRITMDRSKKYVQNIASTIGFPTAVPTGGVFNFNHEDKLNTESSQVSIPFRCIGMEYNDPILISEFNKLVARFNPHMRDADTKDPARIDDERKKYMRKITDADKPLLNFRCYPRISLTHEMEWWIPIDLHEQILRVLKG